MLVHPHTMVVDKYMCFTKWTRDDMSKLQEHSGRTKNVTVDQTILQSLKDKGYNIVNKIGEGSYGTVFLAYYKPKGVITKVDLACKIIDTKTVAKEYSEKFLPRELDVLAKIMHPNIIGVHSIFAKRTQYFIFLNYAENGDLLTFIIKNGPLREDLTFKWFRQLTDAVHYLHDLDIAHRDLKCENLLISAKFNIKLSDFGFSRSVIDKEGKYSKSETYCGSISYAAPEILSGTPYEPKRTDMWAMGVILYVMLNKALPFFDKKVQEIYDKQIHRAWYFRSKVGKIVTQEVKDLVAALLNPVPCERMMCDGILECQWFIKSIQSSLTIVYDVDEPESTVSPYDWVPYSIAHTTNDTPSDEEGSTHYLIRDKKRIGLRRGL